MASEASTSIQLYYWVNCPTEILCLIFKLVDARTFFKCRLVCKRWKEIADNIGEDHRTWKQFCKHEYPDFYLDFNRKTGHPWINVYKNLQLWPQLKSATQEFCCTLWCGNSPIVNMHIFKDKLIVITSTCIECYKINDFNRLYVTLIKNVDRLCCDYQENEYMSLEITSNETLCLYGKSSPEDFFENPLPQKDRHDNIKFYRLQENSCYYIDKRQRTLWVSEWKKNSWTETFWAKYHGVVPIIAMNICKDEGYILLQSGDIYKTSSSDMRFHKICTTVLPLNTNFAYLYGKYDVLVSDRLGGVPFDFQRINGHNILQVPGATCYTEHAGKLVLGKSNLEVPVYSMEDSNEPEQEIYLKPKASNCETIMAVDVYEALDTHVVFAASNSRIYVIEFHYPNKKIPKEVYQKYCIK